MNTTTHRPGRIIVALTALALAATLTACKSSGPSTQSVTLNGAGSTFVNPAMSRWTYEFAKQNPGLYVNYQSIGSGGGVQQVKSGTVDFGASDYALTDKNLATMAPVLQIPETAGPVCITYNVPGVTQPIQLSAEAIAGIYLGKITTWQDPILQKDNPGVNLPNIKVVVAHRTDGSGTTAAFTTYLSAVSPEWATKVGSGGAVSWPVGLGGKGSEGVTAQVRQSPGGIGYVELIYAQQNKLAIASVRNQAGRYIAPSTASTTAAITAFASQIDSDPRLPIVNAPATAPEAYPISTLTFLIIPKDGADAARRSALKKFVLYVINGGQATAGALNYAPLPASVKQYDQNLIDRMTVNGQPVQ